jgi:hypothetical protein
LTVVAEREANPIDKKDLLNTMLHSSDPQTGKKMSSDSISRNVCHFIPIICMILTIPVQLITFLIAGTSLAKFRTYYQFD